MIPSRAKGPVKMFRKLFSYRRSCSHKHCTPPERLCHSVRPAHESSFLFWNGKDKHTERSESCTEIGVCQTTICLPFLASGLYRWSRNRTGSAPTKGGRGLGDLSHCHCTPFELFCSFGTLWQRKQLPYRQWGITPRPETNFLAQSIACRPRLVKRKLFDLYIFYQSIPFLFSSQPCSGGCDMIS